jgi:hypothetical protein
VRNRTDRLGGVNQYLTSRTAMPKRSSVAVAYVPNN